MIHSQYGCEVTRVIECNLDKGTATIELGGHSDDAIRKNYPLISLKADGGMDEIIAKAETLIETTRH